MARKQRESQIPDGLPPAPTEASEAEDLLNAQLDAMLGRAKARNQAWQDIWDEGRQMVFGDQLAGHRIKKGWTPVQVNILFSGVAQSLAAITQRQFDIDATPVEEDDAESATFWAGLLRYDADREIELNRLLKRCVLVGKTDGQWIVRPFWNPRAEWDEAEQRWRGAVRTTLLRSEQVYVDDSDADTLAGANSICTERMVSVDQLLRELPNFREEILDAAAKWGSGGLQGIAADIAAGIETGPSGTQRDTLAGGAGATDRLVNNVYSLPSGPFDGPETISGGAAGGRPGLPSHIPFQCFYWRDWSEQTVRYVYPPAAELVERGAAVMDETGQFAMDPSGQSRLSAAEGSWPIREAADEDAALGEEATAAVAQRPKFPYGRYVYRVGRRILNVEEAAQRWPIDAGFPFIEGINWPLAFGWRGENDVEMARHLQDAINRLYGACVNNVEQLGDPKVKVEDGALMGSGEDAKKKAGVGSGPGAVIKCNQGRLSGVASEPPPPMNQAHLALIAPFERAARDLTGSGTQPIGLGRGEGSGGGMTAREAILRDSNGAMRSTLSGVLVDDFIVRLMNYVAALERYYREPGDLVRIVGKRRAREVMEFTDKARGFRFDVKLRTTSTMAFDLEQRQRKLVELSGNPLIGPAVLKELVEAYRDVLPDPAAVLARCEAWARVQEQLMAQQATEEAGVLGGEGGNGQWRKASQNSPKRPNNPMAAGLPALS